MIALKVESVVGIRGREGGLLEVMITGFLSLRVYVCVCMGVFHVYGEYGTGDANIMYT